MFALGSEENEPQINADERRFVALNPSLFIGSWNFALFACFAVFDFIHRRWRKGKNEIAGILEIKPQINADERRFVASNPSPFIGS